MSPRRTDEIAMFIRVTLLSVIPGVFGALWGLGFGWVQHSCLAALWGFLILFAPAYLMNMHWAYALGSNGPDLGGQLWVMLVAAVPAALGCLVGYGIALAMRFSMALGALCGFLMLYLPAFVVTQFGVLAGGTSEETSFRNMIYQERKMSGKIGWERPFGLVLVTVLLIIALAGPKLC